MIHLLHHKVLLVYQVFDKNIGVKENIQDQEIEETKEKKIIKEVIDKDTEEDIVVLEVELLLIKEGEIINDIAAKELNTIQIENTHNGIGMKSLINFYFFLKHCDIGDEFVKHLDFLLKIAHYLGASQVLYFF